MEWRKRGKRGKERYQSQIERKRRPSHAELTQTSVIALFDARTSLEEERGLYGAERSEAAVGAFSERGETGRFNRRLRARDKGETKLRGHLRFRIRSEEPCLKERAERVCKRL